YTIPSGWKIMVCSPTIHLNPEKYEDPLAFNPWRWEGLVTRGWITKIEKHGCFVKFYNGVQGFASRGVGTQIYIWNLDEWGSDYCLDWSYGKDTLSEGDIFIRSRRIRMRPGQISQKVGPFGLFPPILLRSYLFGSSIEDQGSRVTGNFIVHIVNVIVHFLVAFHITCFID
ncbi:hypothetical protein IFM89_002706, partial [Coptis chinensis]